MHPPAQLRSVSLTSLLPEMQQGDSLLLPVTVYIVEATLGNIYVLCIKLKIYTAYATKISLLKIPINIHAFLYVPKDISHAIYVTNKELTVKLYKNSFLLGF